MAISGLLGRHNLKNLTIEIIPPEEIFADINTPIKIKLKNNKKFFPSFLLKVTIKDKTILFPYIYNRGEASKQTLIKFKKRGYNEIESVKICSIFPFNFFIRCKTYKINQKILVFPKPLKCNLVELSEKDRKKHKEKYIQNRGYEGDIIGLRDYIKGDPLKLIHWKLSAKTGDLKTKELSSTGYQSVIIDFDKLEGNLERKISCATYQILKNFKKVIPVGLKIGKKLYKPEYSRLQKLKLLKILALYNKE